MPPIGEMIIDMPRLISIIIDMSSEYVYGPKAVFMMLWLLWKNYWNKGRVIILVGYPGSNYPCRGYGCSLWILIHIYNYIHISLLWEGRICGIMLMIQFWNTGDNMHRFGTFMIIISWKDVILVRIWY